MRVVFILFASFFLLTVLGISSEFLPPKTHAMNTVAVLLLYVSAICICLIFLGQTIIQQRNEDQLPLPNRVVWKRKAQRFLFLSLLSAIGGLIAILFIYPHLSVMKLRGVMALWLTICYTISILGINSLSIYYSKNKE